MTSPGPTSLKYSGVTVGRSVEPIKSGLIRNIVFRNFSMVMAVMVKNDLRGSVGNVTYYKMIFFVFARKYPISKTGKTQTTEQKKQEQISEN